MSQGNKPITVIVVDDSIIIRGIFSRLLRAEQDIEVVSTAIDGVMAVEHAKNLKPDIIVLDIEMPQKDGLTALPEILAVSPKTKIIMASTLTKRNASISMKALELGASDYLQKPVAGEKDEMERFSYELISKIYALSGRPIPMKIIAKGPASQPEPAAEDHMAAATAKQAAPANVTQFPSVQPRALAIASSTGGPQALTTLFKGLVGHLNQIPIFITQHMPPAFTTILATNLASASKKSCREPEHEEVIYPGQVYVAPGDYHMTFHRSASEVRARLNQGEMVNFCRPSADPMIDSLVDIYGKHLMLVVLTGMGQDGMNGAKAVVNAGGMVVAQDKDSCVVWGMPRAVTQAGLAGTILPLDKIAPYLIKAFGEVG